MLNEVLYRSGAERRQKPRGRHFSANSEALLRAANCRVIAIDRDPQRADRAAELKRNYGTRFDFRPAVSAPLTRWLPKKLTASSFDIGVSSMQIDQAERGFYRKTPLWTCGCPVPACRRQISSIHTAKRVGRPGLSIRRRRKSRQIAARIVEARQTADRNNPATRGNHI